MEILFEVNFSSGRIQKVMATKTTEKSVVVERGFNHTSREPWQNAYTGFYRTFHEARKAGKERLNKDIEALTMQLAKKSQYLTALTNLEEEYVYEPTNYVKLNFSQIKV